MARVVAFHISGTSPERLIPFYDKLFGWKFHKAENPRPTWFIETGAPSEPGIDGMLHTREHDQAVVNTVETADIDAATAMITELGGRLLDRRSIPGAGELALFADPEDNVFQLRQPER